MRRRVFLSPQAEDDLSDIWAYIALERQAPLSADRFIAKLQAKANALARSPRMGRQRQDLGEGVRSLSFGRYLIFYREAPSGIEIARVLSGSMKLPDPFS